MYERDQNDYQNRKNVVEYIHFLQFKNMAAALRAAHLSASLMADWACAHVRFASQTQEWNGIARAVSIPKRASPMPSVPPIF